MLSSSSTDSVRSTVVDAKRKEPILNPEKVQIPYELLSYDMPYVSMGRAFIFSHEVFDEEMALTERKGNEHDQNALIVALAQLGFDKPKIYSDCTFIEIQQLIESASQEDYSMHNGVVLCFLTHGKNGKLCARDREYPVEAIWNPFLKENKNLVGKPKIFIVQACQGESADAGFRKMSVVDAAGVKAPKEPDNINLKVPCFADILLAYSTPAGFVSYREEQTGSWFIQSLCQCIDQVKDSLSQYDIETILTMVKHYVATNLESKCNLAEYHNKKQIPYISSTFTKKLYFASQFKYEESECNVQDKVGITSNKIKVNGADVQPLDTREVLDSGKVNGNSSRSQDTINNTTTNVTVELPSGVKLHVFQTR